MKLVSIPADFGKEAKGRVTFGTTGKASFPFLSSYAQRASASSRGTLTVIYKPELLAGQSAHKRTSAAPTWTLHSQRPYSLSNEWGLLLIRLVCCCCEHCYSSLAASPQGSFYPTPPPRHHKVNMGKVLPSLLYFFNCSELTSKSQKFSEK